uniref:ATP synthase complex subunit 8 n=1 Tax=Agasicles hygrophila TaxID=715812 RepID=A0A0U2P640_9CUCU|nr:ATP synthase F0 subunit 8 [Agasicles hygrophila]ALJ78614.1 ATP synthase F0 subunit 8 [Agasicles hygrophila]ASO76780.1 ATP synthase F0 subunit 8 [Agasicles hygrophila]
MPQMMPLNWTLLMLFFLIIFYLYNILNFYSMNYNSIKTSTKMKTTSINWKW